MRAWMCVKVSISFQTFFELQIALSQKSPFFVNISPHQDALHWRIIDVMDACAAAGVESLSFSKAL